MWVKLKGYSFSIGIGFKEPGSEWLTFTQYGYLVLAIGILSWVSVKLPVVIILVGVSIIVTSLHFSVQ